MDDIIDQTNKLNFFNHIFYKTPWHDTCVIEQCDKHFLFKGEKNNDAACQADETKAIKTNGWLIGSMKSHISPANCIEKIGDVCDLSPPEMCFGKNQLFLFHDESRLLIQFYATEALKMTHFKPGDTSDQLKVITAFKPCASNDATVKQLNIPYDWTFTTDYNGNLVIVREEGNAFVESTQVPIIDETQERINYEKLKEHEPIWWYDDIHLFEDELHDHGVSTMSVKVRVMPSGFFILSRFWMRLDHVVLRLNETRIHHLFDTNYLLRESSQKEITFETLAKRGYSTNVEKYTDVQKVQHLLDTKSIHYEKILLQ